MRPIAVGEVLRRLVSKCAMASVKQKAINQLSPLQLGVGVKGVCETVVHTVQSQRKSGKSDKSFGSFSMERSEILSTEYLVLAWMTGHGFKSRCKLVEED